MLKIRWTTQKPLLPSYLLTEKVMRTIVPGQQCIFTEYEENCTRCAYYTFTRHLVANKVEKPSKIHSPYFISIILHLCILIKFSAFFAQFFSCFLFSILFCIWKTSIAFFSLWLLFTIFFRMSVCTEFWRFAFFFVQFFRNWIIYSK